MNQQDPQLNIRRSTPSDIPVLIDFMRDIDRSESLLGNTRPGQFVTDETTALLETCVSFLAIIQSEFIGAISVLTRSQPGAESELHERYALIYLLAVQENWRNQGVGSRLLQHILSWIKDEKIGQVTLTVKTTNEGAMRLYRSFGFTPLALTMHRRLGSQQGG